MLPKESRFNDSRYAQPKWAESSSSPTNIFSVTHTRNVLDWNSEQSIVYETYAQTAKERQKQELAKALEEQIAAKNFRKNEEKRRRLEYEQEEEDRIKKQAGELYDQYRIEAGIKTPEEKTPKSVESEDKTPEKSNGFNYNYGSWTMPQQRTQKMDFNRSNIFDNSARVSTQLNQLDSLIENMKVESKKAQKARIDVEKEFDRYRSETPIRDPFSSPSFNSFAYSDPSQSYDSTFFQKLSSNSHYVDFSKTTGASRNNFYRPRGNNVQDELEKLDQLISTELNVPIETDIRSNTPHSTFSRESNINSRQTEDEQPGTDNDQDSAQMTHESQTNDIQNDEGTSMNHDEIAEDEEPAQPGLEEVDETEEAELENEEDDDMAYEERDDEGLEHSESFNNQEDEKSIQEDITHQHEPAEVN